MAYLYIKYKQIKAQYRGNSCLFLCIFLFPFLEKKKKTLPKRLIIDALKTGLKRTGKSCRLRWLNYLRPDVRRGNITLEEQLLILELHSRWGNR